MLTTINRFFWWLVGPPERKTYLCGRCHRWFPITNNPRKQLARHPGKCTGWSILDELAEL